jgi:hypothetical protein
MTTPFIPTKIELNLLTYSPEELAGDAALEAWLIALRGNDAGGPYPEGLIFMQALMTAHRTAANTAYSSAAGWKTFTFEFTTYGGLTKNQKANYIATALGAGTKYNYTVTGPVGASDGTVIISWA